MSVTGRAIWYIESHLRSELSLAIVADAIGVSTFHLCRAFPVSTGISFASYLRGRRLSEAAEVLAQGASDILTVALDRGYGSHEAFTRAFRQQFGLTPEQVRSRQNTNHLSLLEPITMQQTKTSTNTALLPPRTAKHEALLIFGLGRPYSCQDSNAGIPSQWDLFLPHFGNIPGQVGKIAYGVICNSDAAGSYDYICGVEVTAFPSHPADYTRLRIPPQTYAVFDHKDHISTVNATWSAIWNQGLTDAGFQAVDGPAFERYGEEFDGRTGLGGLELWIPIKA
jgi:AraC family transcriptional regulator